MNTIYALLAHSWSGLVIAALVALLGWLIVRAARWRGYPRVRFVGYAIYGLAVLLAAGSIVTLVRISRAEAGHPPMGKLIDVGGYRMHILAEGDAKGGPTLVWIPGGHGAGLGLYHLHKAMRNETRSDPVRPARYGLERHGTLPTPHGAGGGGVAGAARQRW